MVETNNRVREFLTSVGGDRMMRKVNVGDRMLRHAARKNIMPATWYAAAKEAAQESGQPEPDLDLFDFKGGRPET